MGLPGSVFAIETTPCEPLNRVAKRRLGLAVVGSNQVNPKLLFIDPAKAKKAQAAEEREHLLQSASGLIADIGCVGGQK